jgi:propionyl-CoA carboxylase alpha chain
MHTHLSVCLQSAEQLARTAATAHRKLEPPRAHLAPALRSALPAPRALPQELAVVEAMKMQNILRAPCDAVVSELVKLPGETLSVDDIILEFAVPEAAASPPA